MKKIEVINLLNNKHALRWLYSQLKPYRKELPLLILFTVLISGIEVSIAIISKEVIDYAIAKDLRKALPYFIGFTIAILIEIGSAYFIPLYRNKIREKMINGMQFQFMERYYHLDWLSANKRHTGEYNTYINNDIPKIVNGIIDIATSIFSLSIELLFASLALYYYDPLLAIFIIVLAPVSILASRFWRKKLHRLQHEIQDTEGKYASLINESIENNVIVKVFDQDGSNMNAITSLQNKRFFLIKDRTKTSALGNLVINSGYQISYLFAIIWGSYQISLGQITYGTFAAFLQLIGNIQSPIGGLGSTIPILIGVLTSAERIMSFEAEPLENKEIHTPIPLTSPVGIHIEHLNWAYSPDNTIFCNTHLKIKPGGMIGIIGASGEGKTTLFHILLGLININDPSAITLYDQYKTIEGNPYLLRSYISYVPQGNTLFSGTIKDNLLLAHPEATDQELNEALEIACADRFVNGLEEGLMTIIGERGVGLSVGQAQRLCIARALLKKAPIILLDEATSALDVNTEEIVLSNIKSHLLKRTCIAITHRRSILSLCEEVYELKNHEFYRIQ